MRAPGPGVVSEAPQRVANAAYFKADKEVSLVGEASLTGSAVMST